MSYGGGKDLEAGPNSHSVTYHFGLLRTAPVDLQSLEVDVEMF